ncbi:MAG TPA: hypothetical protein VFM01_18595 [Nakamurella sp.]|nr:hypothetical protein [Nakamurella sp.]
MSADTTVDFSDLRRADTVRITTNMNVELARVENPQTIAAVVDWLCERSHGWSVPPGSAMVLDDRLNFYADGRTMGNVGVASTVMTAHRKGRFYQRPAEPGDRRELFALLGFDLGDD